MKTVDVAKATASLADYAKEAKRGPVIVTSRGKPVAALVAIEDGDIEAVSLSTNPTFLTILKRSRARLEKEGGIPIEEVRRKLGLEKSKKRSR